MTAQVLSYISLDETFRGAKENNAKYVGAAIVLPGAAAPEVIINPAENFDEKLAYYKNTYDDTLAHKHVEGLFISGLSYGNSFAEIEADLLG